MAAPLVQAGDDAATASFDRRAIFEVFHPAGDLHWLSGESGLGICNCGDGHDEAKLGHENPPIRI
jgi:hypothetical protein